jgi:SAM-dependent methyltransferase
MSEAVRDHYERYPYPHFSLLASVRRQDTYALNLESLWARFNGVLPPAGARRILLAGCGSFSPYPTSLANPAAEIVALDLSLANLRRARLHARLHGCWNIRYEQGDLLDSQAAPGEFGFIDCYGVLHHLADPRAGLAALARRLAPGGIMRLMVYSRSARQEAESIRRALRHLGISDVAGVRDLIRRAPADSRFGQYVREAAELSYASGLADALLHPQARTFRSAELLALIEASGLQPLLFTHPGALRDVAAEVLRLQAREAAREPLPNFALYLGRAPAAPAPPGGRTLLRLNPALGPALGMWRLAPLTVAPRLGGPIPLLDLAARRFLRRFRQPLAVAGLDEATLRQAQPYLDALFLYAYADG